MRPISFRANYIQPATILKRINSDDFQPSKASIVELDKASLNDQIVLSNLDITWGGDTYASDIFDDIYLQSNKKKNTHVFLLTEQRNKFDTLDPNDIMAVAEFEEGDDYNELVYLQVNPEYSASNFYRPIKYAGTALVKFLNEHFPEKITKLVAVKTAEEFYSQNKFSQIPGKSSGVMWNA